MKPTDRRELLRSRPPFDRLREDELGQVAAVLQAYRFEPGAVVRLAGEVPSRLLILEEGGWHDVAGPVPPILGVNSLVNGRPVRTEIIAGTSGASALILTKAHFFTILHACPSVLLALMSLADLPEQERGFR